ncbi:PHD and RING finger domain-containing protein [Lachnellula occidentalis]|uniref:PHD and RING finger domain-containing protein n=1 Tax=Lachnellula occidentalis TaxID=215460 RepID=A0A8H8S895_9HELO|nr:PHD and RING finger domain-containing protein [Lachnellula occidentalis]
MAEQCIVCLEDLDVVPDPIVPHLEIAGPSADLPATTHPGKLDNNQTVALIKPCGHVLHDECLREWSQKANSCPICRQTFNLVEVLDKVGGIALSEYQVEDKKQEASTTFDPNWIVDEVEEEEEESRPCPVCDQADQEEVLLLCDACNAPYHTHCIGLGDQVPNGSWFCMECEDDGAPARAAELREAQPERAPSTGRFGPRTQAAVRRNRRQARTDHWFGTWSVIGTRVHNQVGLDLDFSDEDESESMNGYRTMLHRNSIEQSQMRQFQRRLNIATRQGARDVFQHLAPPSYRPPQRVRNRTPPTPAETVEQSRAWGAFEKAKEIDTTSPKNRKRKSRSATASPGADPELPAEPERKLKRPRTRRVLEPAEASSSVDQPTPQTNGDSRPISPPAQPGPSFLQSLLKEVDMNATSDDDTSRSGFSATTTSGPNRVTSPSVDYSSPAASPSSSSSHTPRGLSITPPPHIVQRKGSPRPMTSRVEPIYPPADYSPNRSPGEASSSPTEIRQPRPRRQKPRPLALARSPDTSPVRASMTAEAKEGINKIVKSVLAPHWKSQRITKEQYADINREVSRKLYEIVADRGVAEDKERWEKIATSEVATAVDGLAT